LKIQSVFVSDVIYFASYCFVFVVFKVQLELLSAVVSEACRYGLPFFHLMLLSRVCRFTRQIFQWCHCCWR